MTNSSSQKRGRPTLLNRRIINQLAHAAQAGKTREEMAAHIGVSLSTLQGWITQGRKAREEVLAQGGRAVEPAANWTALPVEQRALHLVVALDVADRKRRAVDAILSDEQLERHVPKGRKPIGRPALLSPALVDAVVGPCAAGDLGTAATAAGVDRRSVQRWLTRGRTVHAAGRATTEYERLCGTLYARVEAASNGTAPEPTKEPATAEQEPASRGTTAIVLTEERVQQLAGAVEGGATRVEAAARAGISYRTFARWLALGAAISTGRAPASEHERLCGVLRVKITAADDSAAAAGPDAAPGLFALGGTVDTEALARKLNEGSVCIVPPTVSGTPARAAARTTWRSLLGRVLTNRFAFRALRA
ncbi:hypothetical protein EF903_17940 [Streptomyces sp. WAC05292]|uniref:hypothetical protein n=1 Tax=Streptomyces sp. WAC05292 TaxID=2487418 RepID=UPI000F748483|nr:hypothetical protein [Streptomyces sp. WAC05292]RSS86994.1 hypothetical protein EF903_17940 [Streptomyces sp. WAC05292]